MSTEPFIGEIKTFAFNFAPLGHSTCQGQLMSIPNYTALFALIGTTYGGNGQTTFNLPDLQGRTPIHQGQGPGLPAYMIGEAGGSPTATLTGANLPAHVHTLNQMVVNLNASSGNADEAGAQSNYPAVASTNVYTSAGPTPSVYTGGTEVSGTTDVAGSGVAFSIANPYLVINYSIALEGIFPSRN